MVTPFGEVESYLTTAVDAAMANARATGRVNTTFTLPQKISLGTVDLMTSTESVQQARCRLPDAMQNEYRVVNGVRVDCTDPDVFAQDVYSAGNGQVERVFQAVEMVHPTEQSGTEIKDLLQRTSELAKVVAISQKEALTRLVEDMTPVREKRDINMKKLKIFFSGFNIVTGGGTNLKLLRTYISRKLYSLRGSEEPLQMEMFLSHVRLTITFKRVADRLTNVWQTVPTCEVRAYFTLEPTAASADIYTAAKSVVEPPSVVSEEAEDQPTKRTRGAICEVQFT